MSDKSRRKLLKSIAVGSGVIVAGKNLPESWSRPVVDSVMLPAHAQTSPSLEVCDNTQIIPGRAVTCSDISFVEATLYTFSYADGCLSMESESVGQFTPVTNQNQLLVAAWHEDIGSYFYIEVRIVPNTPPYYTSHKVCNGQPVASFDTTVTRSLIINAVPFTASFNIARTVSAVSHGQITVAPT